MGGGGGGAGGIYSRKGVLPILLLKTLQYTTEKHTLLKKLYNTFRLREKKLYQKCDWLDRKGAAIL